MEYEGLIMLWDTADGAPEKKEKHYRKGDIVAVRPKGWSWGRLEKKEFLIVGLGELSEEEVDLLSRPLSIDYEEVMIKERMENVTFPLTAEQLKQLPFERKHEYGSLARMQEIVAQRRFHIDLDGLLENEKKKKSVFDRKVEYQPYRKTKVAVCDKMDRPEVLMQVNSRKIQLRAMGHEV